MDLSADSESFSEGKLSSETGGDFDLEKPNTFCQRLSFPVSFSLRYHSNKYLKILTKLKTKRNKTVPFKGRGDEREAVSSFL